MGSHQFIEIAGLRRIRETFEAPVPSQLIGTVVFEHRILRGEPAKEILRLAKDERADSIFMGTHGRTGLMRALMGSVAEQVVRKATCPVVTMRVPDSSADGAEE